MLKVLNDVKMREIELSGYEQGYRDREHKQVDVTEKLPAIKAEECFSEETRYQDNSSVTKQKPSVGIKKILRDPRLFGVVLLCVGTCIILVTCILSSRVIHTKDAKLHDWSWSQSSLPVYEGTCPHVETRLRAGVLVVNIFGTVVMVLSGMLQQSCTSPTIQDLSRALKDHGDFTFGGNQPLSMFRRKRPGNIILWVTLVATSVPLHLLLNGMLGQSYKFDSLNDLELQIADGTCQIVLRPWISIIVGIMVLIKASAILGLVLSDAYWHEERCKSLGDLIAVSVTHHEMVIETGTIMHKYTRNWDLLPKMSLLKHITWMDMSPLLLGTLALLGVVVDVSARYNSPQGESLSDTIIVLLAANFPQVAFSIFFACVTQMINQLFMEFEWRDYESEKQLPRVTRPCQGGRNTRFLTLPYWATLLLTGFSTLLHFSISQVQDVIQIYVEPATVIVGFTYSKQHSAWVVVVYVAPALLWTYLISCHLWPLKGHMPIMYGSGRVVLAACSELRDHDTLPSEGIQWGDLGQINHGRRRAGLSSRVGAVEQAELYI